MDANHHLQLEKKQISTKWHYAEGLLADFRRSKMKCLELCEQANEDMPDLQRYEVLEVTCTRQIDSLSLMEVIHLKQQLAASTLLST